MNIKNGIVTAVVACCVMIGLVTPSQAAPISPPPPSYSGELSVNHAINTDGFSFVKKSTAVGGNLRIGGLLGPAFIVLDGLYSINSNAPLAIADYWSAGLEVPVDGGLSLFATYKDGWRDCSLYRGQVWVGAKLRFGG